MGFLRRNRTSIRLLETTLQRYKMRYVVINSMLIRGSCKIVDRTGRLLKSKVRPIFLTYGFILSFAYCNLHGLSTAGRWIQDYWFKSTLF